MDGVAAKALPSPQGPCQCIGKGERFPMNKSWRWISIGALAVIVAVAALLVARSSFASGFFASPTADLSHTNWSLVSINGQAPITGRALTLKFQSGTQLAGDSGCNSYGAQYQVNGSAMRVDQLMSTLRACVDQSLNDQEALFQSALSHAAQFSVAGSQLTLKNASGGQVLVFQKQ
jgi:heat shock protein HslJ